MLNKNIGALTIGQSPRPDLVAPLIQRLPVGYQVIQAGALDGLSTKSLPPISSATYPLSTRLLDGTLVIVEEAFLAAKLQVALDLLEAQAVLATLLLCAGTFAELSGTRPLFKPFTVCCDVLQTGGMQTIGLIAPIKEQEVPIRQRWQSAGFQTVVWTADLTRQDKQFARQLAIQIETNKLECIVLDYVGHPTWVVQQLQKFCSVPVIDLGQLAVAILSGTL